MTTEELFKQVYKIIETDIKPFIAADGGHIELENVDDNGVVYVTLGGACAGCMGAAYTLKRRCRAHFEGKNTYNFRSQIGNVIGINTQ